MTFEELKNGMKDLFSSLGAKTSDSNYAVGLFDKTSAEPKGIMDMASLASVLGVVPYVNMGYPEYRSYRCTSSGARYGLCLDFTNDATSGDQSYVVEVFVRNGPANSSYSSYFTITGSTDNGNTPPTPTVIAISNQHNYLFKQVDKKVYFWCQDSYSTAYMIRIAHSGSAFRCDTGYVSEIPQ